MNRNKYILEVCVDTIDSVDTALTSGADRIELCSALSEGGLTPSAGLIRYACAVAKKKMKVNVLIRCRRGDFLYTDKEIEVMVDDIRMARELGADGVVIGALTKDGEIDIKALDKFIDTAGDGMTITFHRAFDMVRDANKSLQQLMERNIDIVLTSGCAPSAIEGAEELKNLVKIANNKIAILAGGGVTPINAKEIISLSGVKQIHGSLRKNIISEMTFRRDNVAMGAESDEYSRQVADSEKIKSLIQSLS